MLQTRFISNKILEVFLNGGPEFAVPVLLDNRRKFVPGGGGGAYEISFLLGGYSKL